RRLALPANSDVPPRLRRAPPGAQNDAKVVRAALRAASAPDARVEAERAAPDGRDEAAAVVELDGSDLPGRGGGHHERDGPSRAGGAEGEQPRHARTRRPAQVDALDRRVRKDVGADLVDVLRLLVVLRLRGAFEEAAADRRRRPR